MKMQNLSRLLLALALLAAGAATAGDDDRDRDERDARSFQFALWGDMPYIAADFPKIAPLIADMNAHRLEFTAFDGDIKSGSTRCDNQVFFDAVDRFNTLRAPTVYVPGDNEWTDCHRINNGGFDNLERLAFLRQTMFSSPRTFGQRKRLIEHQGPLGGLYVENTRWTVGGVVFVGLNIPGSNNNKVDAVDDPARSARTQAQRDADNAEYLARDAANIQWLQESFARAKALRSPGVMIIIQADPGFDIPETETVNERLDPTRDGYTAFLTALEAETRAFAGQVVLVHGDTHFFKYDKPLVTQPNLLENFSRLETFGSPNIHWVRVTVDPRSRNVFNFEPMIVPGN